MIHEDIYNINACSEKNIADRRSREMLHKAKKMNPEADVVAAFNSARKELVNNKVSKSVNWFAYVTSDVYNLLVDSELAKTVKGSTVNVDEGDVYKFKNFILRELADELFIGEENIYFAAANVGQAGVGIPLARTMDSEDFGGVVLQGAGKLGKYVPEKNKKAIIKATLAEVVGG